ncbi:MAG: ABC transporter ATP-binding protein, partial [Planctomycetota bacterium]
EGLIRMRGEPPRAIERLRGRVWKTVIDHGELEAYRERYLVLSNRLNLGRNVVRVHSESSPGERFEPVEPDLEDVYFATLRGLLSPETSAQEMTA